MGKDLKLFAGYHIVCASRLWGPTTGPRAGHGFCDRIGYVSSKRDIVVFRYVPLQRADGLLKRQDCADEIEHGHHIETAERLDANALSRTAWFWKPRIRS